MDKQKIYNNLPHALKNVLVTIYNLRQRKSHGKEYYEHLKTYEDYFFNKSLEEIKEEQNRKFMKLIKLVREKNEYFREKLEGIEINSIDDLALIPIMTKDDLRKESIKTKISEPILKGNTGGTTGKSLHFGITERNFSERMACLDFFRGMYGYQYGDEIAWFSGKEIITPKEVKQNKFWVRDLKNKVTYYSTFHLKNEYIDSMIQNIRKRKPKYLAGFPSAMYDITVRWKETGIEPLQLNAIFPTSEPLLESHKKFMSDFFNCPVPDQYASSEGAPFIYESPEGHLHYDMLSGIFEIKDGSKSGPVLVTSFTTDYMPLIRYDIGDSIEFPEEGEEYKNYSNMPVVKKIEGRSISFVYSEERGKVTNSNISNVIKYLKGVDKFQIIQNKIDEIDVYIVYSGYNKQKTLEAINYELEYRLGNKMKFNYHWVDNISPEKNGKFLMVKNNLKLD